MFLDSGCNCRYCRLSPRIAQRVIDGMFRDMMLTEYGADITRVWAVRHGE